MFGAQQLRNATGGKAFSEAWDAALDIARDREFSRIRGNLTELASETEAANSQAADRGLVTYTCDDEDDDESGHREYLETQANIAEKLLRARRLYLMEICDRPDARAAWELLVGPTDWDKARRGEPQDNEHLVQGVLPAMREPDMLLTAEAGWLGDFTGGPNKKDALREGVAKLRSTEAKTNDGAADASA